MPIHVELDPYVFLIENTTVRENMIQALQTYMNSSIGFDSTLQTAAAQPGTTKIIIFSYKKYWTFFVPGNYEDLWASFGSPVYAPLTCRRYDEFDGYKRIGDACNTSASYDLDLQCKLVLLYTFVPLSAILTYIFLKLLRRSRPMPRFRVIRATRPYWAILWHTPKCGSTQEATLISMVDFGKYTLYSLSIQFMLAVS